MATPLPDIEPTHPGEVLKDDFMDELGLTCYGIAKACGIPRTRIERVYRGERPITADTALRLERCLGVSANFWLGLQAQYDIDVARREIGDTLGEVEQLNEPVVVEPKRASVAESIVNIEAQAKRSSKTHHAVRLDRVIDPKVAEKIKVGSKPGGKKKRMKTPGIGGRVRSGSRAGKGAA